MMLNYNIKLVIRNVIKHKRFFIISIASLVAGITTACLLWMHISFEKSYDQFYRNTDDIYRVSFNVNQNGKQIINSSRTPTALSFVLGKESTHVAASSRSYYEDCYMYTDDVKLNNQKVIWADSSFLSVFQPEMIVGNPKVALNKRKSVVISDRISKIYFKGQDPIGKVIKLNEGIPFTVTGVFKSLPSNTHMQYDFVVSFSTLAAYGLDVQGNWGRHWVNTYIRKHPESSPAQIEKALAELVKKYMNNRIDRGQEITFSLVPVKDIYLGTSVEGEFHPMGSASKVNLLVIIALFMIVIAWVNNINITTALSFERAKDSGIRKINGAKNSSLFQYYLTESFFINLTALIISIVLVILIYPLFKNLVDGAIDYTSIANINALIILAMILITGAIFTGVLPALIQTSFKTIQILQNNLGDRLSFNGFRKTLAVIQFALAIILIGSTILIFKQIRFLESCDLGIKASQVMVFKGPATNNTTGVKRYNDYLTFRKELLKSPHFSSMTASMNVPGQANRYRDIPVARNGKPIDASFNTSLADEGYFETYQTILLEGRNFYSDMENDRASIIINQSALYAMGFDNPQEAIGERIRLRNQERKIVAVVKDFHHESLEKEIEPYIYEFRHPQEFGYFPTKMSTNNFKEAIEYARKVWQNHYPDAAFDVFFLDEFFNRQYFSYHQLGQLVGYSSILSILIACLGLFALISFAVNKRIKEIGIRKVNGATSAEILNLLNKDSIKWVAIAIIVALPMSYFSMKKWLEGFAYQTELSWWIFVLSGFLALFIAFVTVSAKSIRAAKRNPVESLRYE